MKYAIDDSTVYTVEFFRVPCDYSPLSNDNEYHGQLKKYLSDKIGEIGESGSEYDSMFRTEITTWCDYHDLVIAVLNTYSGF
jgi:hypothetical protein